MAAAGTFLSTLGIQYLNMNAELASAGNMNASIHCECTHPNRHYGLLPQSV